MGLNFTGAKELFDSGCGVVFGAHPSQISLLFFLHYCKCAGGVEPILESGDGSGQEWRIKVEMVQVERDSEYNWRYHAHKKTI